MTKFKVFLLFSFLAGAAPCLANPGSWMPEYQKISNIIVEGGNSGSSALIIVEGGVPSAFIPDACDSPYNKADLTTEHGRSVYTAALSAHVSGKPVKMALACSGSRPFITHIKI